MILGKKIMFCILCILIIFSFAAGFFTGDRYGETIGVFQERLVPIYKVDRNDNRIAVTLDGTWGAEYTEKILELFAEHDITITFFFAGYWLEKYPELVKEIADHGHEIGNHTYTHPHCNKLSVEELEDELKRTSNLIKELIGREPRFFRPPFGEYNNRVIETCRNNGYQVIQWSLDSLDWKEPGADFIVRRIKKNVSSGDIILMHNNAPDILKALKILIPELKKMGYKIVPLSKLVYKDYYIIHSHNGLQVRKSDANE